MQQHSFKKPNQFNWSAFKLVEQADQEAELRVRQLHTNTVQCLERAQQHAKDRLAAQKISTCH